MRLRWKGWWVAAIISAFGGGWTVDGCAGRNDGGRPVTAGHAGGAGGLLSSRSGGAAGGGSRGTGGGPAAGGAIGSGGGLGGGGMAGSAGELGDGGMAGSGGVAGGAGTAGRAGASGAGGMSAQDGGMGATFTALYGAIFGTASCAGTLCHNPGIQKAIDFSTRANAYSSLKFEVVPGNSAGSALYRLLANGTMPPDPAPKLTAGQLAAVAAWIDAGGLDD